MLHKKLSLALSVLFTFGLHGCFLPDSDSDSSKYVVNITNNSEHNITWVVIVDAKTGNIAVNEKGNELIAKDGESKTFFARGAERRISFIVCVEVEGILEPICTTYKDMDLRSDINITWNGWNGWNDPIGSGWYLATSFPNCPKVFPQCSSEVKDE